MMAPETINVRHDRNVMSQIIPLMFEQGEAARPFDVTGWVLRISAGAIFILLGLAKFRPDGYWAKLFTEIGFGVWFRYLAATMQLAGGALFLIPRTAVAGAVITGATMIGAIGVHLFILPTGFGGAVFPAAVLAFIVIAVMRKG
jgi:uncharacterized membrane protein YphA (DoxX/SURF4 family)